MSTLADALICARLCALDPNLGGIVLRGGGELADVVIAELRAALPDGAPLRRVPVHIDDERLLGGLDLTATLARGVAVAQRGLLAEAHGGVVVLPMAERLTASTVGQIASALDTGEVRVERDGVTLCDAARFVVVALDDGIGPDETVGEALAERLAFWVDLSEACAQDPPPPPSTPLVLSLSKHRLLLQAARKTHEVKNGASTSSARAALGKGNWRQ